HHKIECIRHACPPHVPWPQGWALTELLARVPGRADLAEIAPFEPHNTKKRSPAALSKAHRRWYIPLAPRGFGPGCLLRKPPDGIGASGVGQIRFGSVEALRFIPGWSSPVARQAHNLKVIGSNPIPATKLW